MEILIGCIAYALILAFFMAFGKFLKQCDNDMKDMKP